MSLQGLQDKECGLWELSLAQLILSASLEVEKSSISGSCIHRMDNSRGKESSCNVMWWRVCDLRVERDIDCMAMSSKYCFHLSLQVSEMRIDRCPEFAWCLMSLQVGEMRIDICWDYAWFLMSLQVGEMRIDK